MKKSIVVAIDGPAGSGKSTVARLAADRLGFMYLDSGAFYRTYTLHTMRVGAIQEKDKEIARILKESEIRLEKNGTGSNILLNGEKVNREIRSVEVTKNVSVFSRKMVVRDRVTVQLRAIVAGKNTVVEGRDISTVVFPAALLKIYMHASIEERARRRFNELLEAGVNVDLETIKGEITRRDKQDAERRNSPLLKHDEAICLDTTKLDIEQCVDFIVNKVEAIKSSSQNL